MKTIQKTAIALAASGLFATAAFAQTAPAAPETNTISFLSSLFISIKLSDLFHVP